MLSGTDDRTEVIYQRRNSSDTSRAIFGHRPQTAKDKLQRTLSSLNCFNTTKKEISNIQKSTSKT